MNGWMDGCLIEVLYMLEGLGCLGVCITFTRLRSTYCMYKYIVYRDDEMDELID